MGLADIHAHVEEIIRNTFGTEARPTIQPVFRSPYLAHIEANHLYPANWKMPKFDKFSGEENEKIVEHVARFTTQCRKAAVSPFLKMRLFSTSLTKTVFSWYTSLPHNSIQSSIVDLALYRQNTDETVEEYLNRFKTTKNRCFVMMPEAKFTKIAFNGLHFTTRDHFEGRHFPYLFDLGVRVVQYEQFQKK